MELNTLVVAIFCLIILNSNPGFGLEPACSRFHYEEQTLEKMIRQEIFVEKMKSEMDETKVQVNDALVTFKNETVKFSADFEKLENVVKTLGEKVKKTLERVKEENKIILQEYTEEIERLKGIKETPTIAFKADMVSDKSMANNKVLVFSTNMFNIGNAYDNTTGIFKAPVGGIYHFTAQLCLPSGKHAYYGISVNDQIIAKALFGSTWTKCYSMDTIASVIKDNSVSVKCITSCGGESLWSNTYATNSFAGILINK